MKQNSIITVVMIVMLVILSTPCVSASAAIKNGPKPLKGEWDFRLQQVWETIEAKNDVLVQVSQIRVDNEGTIFAYDQKLSRFFVFNGDGKFLYAFGKTGSGPGEYQHVLNHFLVGRFLVVCDVNRMHYFFKDGTYSRTVVFEGRFSIRGFLDENRAVLVKSDDNDKKSTEHLSILDTTTKKWIPILEMSVKKPLAASGGGLVVMVKDSSITPIMVVLVDGDHIYFGKNDTYTIQKIDLKGNPIFSFSVENREPKKIPEAAKRKRFENIIVNGGQMPKEMVDQMIKGMPDQSTFFNGIRKDETDLIYVSIPDLANDRGQEIDIFSPEGKYLYHALIALPGGLKTVSQLHIKGNFLYVFAEDEEGEGKLLKYKMTKPQA